MERQGGKVGKVLVQGYLNRRKMGTMKGRKKWFVLTGRRLQSFKSKEDYESGSVFIDCIDMMEMQTVRALDSRGNAKNSFEIVTRSKAIVFQADSPEKAKEWLEELRRVNMLRYSVSADLLEPEEETRKIESELEKRRSTFKFWRNSRSSTSQITEEDEAITQFGFLEEQTDDDLVFRTQNEKRDSSSEGSEADVRPISGSSGVESTSVEESTEYKEHVNETTQSDDEGISVTTGNVTYDDEEDVEPLYQNLSNSENARRSVEVQAGRRLSSPAIEELKKMVNYDERKIEDNNQHELKGIEQLKALLATMP